MRQSKNKQQWWRRGKADLDVMMSVQEQEEAQSSRQGKGRGSEGDGNSSGSALSQGGGAAAPRTGKEWEPLVHLEQGLCWEGNLREEQGPGCAGASRALGSCKCHLSLEIPLEQSSELWERGRESGERWESLLMLPAGSRFPWIPAALHSGPSPQCPP